MSIIEFAFTEVQAKYIFDRLLEKYELISEYFESKF